MPARQAKDLRLVSLGANSFTGMGTVEFWSFRVKNLRLIGWGGRSNADGHAPEIMREPIELAETGRLRPVVGGTYPFAEAAAAHAAIEARRPIGKVVLTPG